MSADFQAAVQFAQMNGYGPIVSINDGNSSCNIANVGTAGRLLIDQGAATDPLWENVSGQVTILANGSTTVVTCTNSSLGLARPDTTTVTQSSGVLSVPTATSSSLGLVQVDGSTITISGGVISVAAVGPAPNAPTGLTGTPGNTQIAWSWTAPASGQAPSTYNLQIATNSGFTTGVQNFTGIASTSHTVTGLTNGTTYYAQVQGVYNGAAGPYSSSANTAPNNYVMYDTFSSGSNLASHTMNTGQSWTVFGGSGAISGGTVVLTSASSGSYDCWAWANASGHEYSVSITLVITDGTSNFGGCCGRMNGTASIGSESGWMLRWKSGVIQLVRNDTDSYTIVGTYSTGLTSGTHTITLAFSGTSITGSLTGVGVVISATSSTYQTNTYYGIFGGYLNAGAALSSFIVQ